MAKIKTCQVSTDERLPVEVRKLVKEIDEEDERRCWTNERIKSLISDQWEREYRERRFDEVWKKPFGNFIEALSQALDAGFDLYTPPSNWYWHYLTEWYDFIPDEVMERIERVVSIFGLRNIFILSPYSQPWAAGRDPVAIGKVELNDITLWFLIGSWDLERDRRAMTL